MPISDKDLFAEEQSMVAMSFGDHIEELRTRLILALAGLAVGILVTFIPIPRGGGREPTSLGQWVMSKMQEPAQAALDEFYATQARRRATEAERGQAVLPPFEVGVSAADFWAAQNPGRRGDLDRYIKARTAWLDRRAREAARAAGKVPAPLSEADARSLWQSTLPASAVPAADVLLDRTYPLHLTFHKSSWIEAVHQTARPTSALISLAPLESFMIFFMVCMVAGLVLASPWVFYQIWAFVAAGLYRHERHYVTKFLPFSLGLFLGGVFLCFFLVLPYTLKFLLDFNVWLGIEPNLRITDWISFATILPLVFGICFQTPLVMLLLERIGIFTVADFRSKRRYAILIMMVAAAVITPTGDPFTMLVLAVPMIALYELGILMIGSRRSDVPAHVA
jgi:sec-independent protein translocase protein TatC